MIRPRGIDLFETVFVLIAFVAIGFIWGVAL